MAIAILAMIGALTLLFLACIGITVVVNQLNKLEM